MAVAVNGLSDSYQNYLRAGGLGVNIADSALNYRPESIVETYYSYSVTDTIALSLDYQFVANPGSNYMRGPVSVGSVRLHVAL